MHVCTDDMCMYMCLCARLLGVCAQPHGCLDLRHGAAAASPQWGHWICPLPRKYNMLSSEV